MLRRTKGRFLLTMLVITGLAGTFKNTSLTNQERKAAVTSLKETKTNLLKAINGLSEAQLNFRPSPNRWSIRECISHITLAEKNLWDMLGNTMKEPATPEKRAKSTISDEDLAKIIEDRTDRLKTSEQLQPNKASWKSTTETLNTFKTERTNHIKYARSTTEDMRDHFVELPHGRIDAYQFMLFVSAHCNRHTQQIYQIMADPDFPKQ